MNQKQLDEVLRKHKLWLREREGGEKADLRGADLRGADLEGVDLREVNLRRANLKRANLQGADLQGADLEGCNLCNCNFDGAKIFHRGKVVTIRFEEGEL